MQESCQKKKRVRYYAQRKGRNNIDTLWRSTLDQALQAIALSQYLKQNFEFECVDVINYIPKRFKRINRLKNISGHGAKYFMHGLIRMSRFEKTNKKIYILSKRKISPFQSRIYSMREAKAEFGDYDYLIAGSDQIWNSEYNQGIDEMYYLGFASENTTKIAYAASCGKEEYSDTDWDKDTLS